MKKILLLSFLALSAAAFAASNSMKVNIFQDSTVDGKTLKAGEYRVSLENGNAVITHGKETIQVPAYEKTEANKFANTELFYKTNTGNLQEIAVGGTHTRIVFGSAPAANSGM